MKGLVKKGFQKTILALKPVLTLLFLRNTRRVAAYEQLTKDHNFSGMVSAFHVWHRLIFAPFFRRVQVFPEDISLLRQLSGPVVFVMKHRGQLEYRYFNHLVLKEKLAPVSYAPNCFTLFWWPFRQTYRLLVCALKAFYEDPDREAVPETERLKSFLEGDKRVLIRLTISRDYLFGLIKTDPLDALQPLIAIQNKLARTVYVVTFQFLYVKHPERTERSYIDLLFGDKSQPGAIRKFLLFVANYWRSPRVKFGAPIPLRDFLDHRKKKTQAVQAQDLLARIEEDLEVERTRIVGPPLKSRESLIKEIMASPVFLDRLHTLAVQDNKKPDDYKRLARRFLEEIAADVNYNYVHFAHITAGHIWNRIFDGVVVKHDQLKRVREVAGKNPIVLVPMHRSHIDYVLISDIFYEHNITFPHVCAGINMNFWPFGTFARRSGAFFIRRRWGGDQLYKETLYAYVRSLLASGHCLEFFIEGTRSRTGKLLKPRMGILSLIVRAFFEGACDDVSFVPIAVVYDHILEEKAYEKESAGSEKSKEKATDLIRARKFIKKKYGKVYVEFAEPISLKAYFKEKGVVPAPIEESRKPISDLAYHLTYHLNRIAVVTPIALVSLAILSLDKPSFTMTDLRDRIDLLKDYLDFKNVTYSDLIYFSEDYAVSEAIKKLVSRHILKTVQTFEESFYTLEDKHRASLDYYKNNIVHFFVSLACFLKVISRAENQATMTLDAVAREYEVLKTLLRHDFTFSERGSLKGHLLRVITYAQKKGFVEYDQRKQRLTKTLTPALFSDILAFQGLIDNFLESHLIGLRYLKRHHVRDMEAKALIRDILIKARPMYLKGDLTHPEALSGFNLENSLKVFVDLGILSMDTRHKDRQLYNSVSETGLVEKWILSIGDLLAVGPTPAPARPREEPVAAREDLH